MPNNDTQVGMIDDQPLEMVTHNDDQPASGTAPEVVEVFKTIERIQDDHLEIIEQLRQDHRREVDQMRQDLQAQILRLERQNEDLSKAAEHWQVRFLEEHDKVLRLLPAPKDDEPVKDEQPEWESERRPWWRRLFGG